MSPATPAGSHSIAEIATASAQRYLIQLRKHFQHRRPVEQEGASGRITFEIGECRLRAADGVLTLMLDAPDEKQLARLQDVVGRHLLRFAFREELQIAWKEADVGTT